MKVILRQDHGKLGKLGDVLDVKDGYARNFLIPRNIAFLATDNAVKMLDEEKKQNARRVEKEKVGSEKLAAELEKVSLNIQMKVGEDDKLFGSVTSQMIADGLQEKGITIDKRIIELEEPIKALGIYDVPVKLPGGVQGKVKVWVVRE
ncbi:MAG: 50S ribosomal protein L9 [Ignavibacteriae bacterium]|nr:50S ribosomal protein L9 [Ignavibacteriota bacterium]